MGRGPWWRAALPDPRHSANHRAWPGRRAAPRHKNIFTSAVKNDRRRFLEMQAMELARPGARPGRAGRGTADWVNDLCGRGRGGGEVGTGGGLTDTSHWFQHCRVFKDCPGSGTPGSTQPGRNLGNLAQCCPGSGCSASPCPAPASKCPIYPPPLRPRRTGSHFRVVQIICKYR